MLTNGGGVHNFRAARPPFLASLRSRAQKRFFRVLRGHDGSQVVGPAVFCERRLTLATTDHPDVTDKAAAILLDCLDLDRVVLCRVERPQVLCPPGPQMPEEDRRSVAAIVESACERNSTFPNGEIPIAIESARHLEYE